MLETCRTSSLTSLSLRISDSSGFTHSDRDSEIQTLGVCRFLCGAHNLSGRSDFSNTTCWGLTALPVLGVPLKEFKNHEALWTIEMNPGLFQVNCSLNIDQFCELLVDHPNWALVDSVCWSLHKGYWPYADMKFGDIEAGYPTTLDMSSKGLTPNEHLDFIWAQLKVEVAAGRYFASF